MIFDTHAHYDDPAFDQDRDALIPALPEEGIGAIVNVGSTFESLAAIAALSERYDHAYAAYGIHPSELDTVPGVGICPDAIYGEVSCAAIKLEGGMPPTTAYLEMLRDYCRSKKAVAVGEIGLDYHWHKENKAQQILWFCTQIDQARQLQKPVIIHSRDAAEDTLAVAKREKLGEVGGVMHCFSYSVEMAREYLNMGLYLGIGGVLTFSNAKKLREVVQFAPLSQLLLETDCPYLAPSPHRGERNDSRYLPLVVQAIAEIKKISAEEVEAVTWENACELYRIVDPL